MNRLAAMESNRDKGDFDGSRPAPGGPYLDFAFYPGLFKVSRVSVSKHGGKQAIIPMLRICRDNQLRNCCSVDLLPAQRQEHVVYPLRRRRWLPVKASVLPGGRRPALDEDVVL